jgi:hypothetical protein
MLREGAAHDAETDDTDDTALFYGPVFHDEVRAGHMPLIFIAIDKKDLTSRLAIMSLVVAAYFLK